MLQPLFTLAATGSFCWFLASSLVIFPHSLSFFNEAIGGPLNGPKHLLGSSVDWGQDLRYLVWSSQSSDITKVLADVGCYDPNNIGLKCIWISIYQCRTDAIMKAVDDAPGAKVILSVNRIQEYSHVERMTGLKSLSYNSKVMDSVRERPLLQN